MSDFRFSGHETFSCRYTWLPKSVNLIRQDGHILSDDEEAILKLGIGRNMVKALRFWVQAMGVAKTDKVNGYKITDFGEIVFCENGLDKFLEDRKTLWLLHWNLLQNESPLFAWYFLFNKWNQPTIVRNEVLSAFERETLKLEKQLSSVTLEQHFSIFLHTYLPTRGKKGKVIEDNLDCPLAELELIEPTGKKQDEDKFETIYTFRRDSKPDITSDLFIYCLFDYWIRNKPNEELTFREIFNFPNCIGQTFKLSETDLRERLYSLKEDSDGMFDYQETALFQKVTCQNIKKINKNDLLHRVYERNNDFNKLRNNFDLALSK